MICLGCRLESGLPNLSQGILYQKLQMLNCCIDKKLSREAAVSKIALVDSETVTSDAAATAASAQVLSGDQADTQADNIDDAFTDDEDEDEFFDTEETPQTESSNDSEIESTVNTNEDKSKEQVQPRGRLNKLDDLRLLHVEESLYIPVTQEPAPMTEDSLAEHAEVLTR